MMAFEQVEPWGTLPAERRAGEIAATVANANRDPERRREPFEARNFSPVLNAHFDRIEDAEIATMSDAEKIAALDGALFKG